MILTTIVVFLFTLALPAPLVAVASGYEGELLSTFTTSYKESSEGRKSNVEVATKRINGTIINAGEVFSFNDVTGKRRLENGYKQSPVIEEGKYVVGIGGGVCQVSTTLYNAVIRAGLKVLEVSSHSLPSLYVSPSMDAMVSEATDFRFINISPYPITIKGEAKNGVLRFRIYGFKMIDDGEEIKFRSEIKEKIKGEYEEIVDEEGKIPQGEDFLVVKEPKDGLISECYKEIYYRGKLIKSVRIRRDRYAPQSGIKLIRDEQKSESK